MSEGFCLTGNCGFPVVVSGLSSATIPQQANDISFQFSSVQITFDNATQVLHIPGSQSFFIGGSSFMLNTVRMCKATPNGLERNQSILPSLELQFWGTPSANAITNTQAAVLIIPMYGNFETGNTAATNFMNLLFGRTQSLSSVFPEGDKVIRYTTCIEYRDANNTPPYKNKTIAVAYWQNGMKFGFSLSREANNFLANGIPLNITEQQNTYSVNDTTQVVKTISTPIVNAVSSVPYTTTVSAGNVEFSSRFTQMTYSTATASIKKTPKQLKCIAIDRSKDIVNGLLVVDPSTGELLTTEDVSGVDAQFAVIPSSTISGGDVQRWLAIGLGTLGATILLAFVVWVIMRFTAGPTAADIAAAAATATATAALPAIQWIDLLLPAFLGLCLFGIGTIITVSIIMNAS